MILKILSALLFSTSLFQFNLQLGLKRILLLIRLRVREKYKRFAELVSQINGNLRSFQTLKIHYEAKLCILCIVSGFRNKDAPFVLLLFFTFL